MKIVLSRARKAVVRGSACYPIIERRKKTEKKSRLQRAAGDFFLHPRPMKPTGSGGKLKQMVSTIHEPRHVVFALNKISHVRLFAKAHISGSLSHRRASVQESVSCASAASAASPARTASASCSAAALQLAMRFAARQSFEQNTVSSRRNHEPPQRQRHCAQRSSSSESDSSRSDAAGRGPAEALASVGGQVPAPCCAEEERSPFRRTIASSACFMARGGGSTIGSTNLCKTWMKKKNPHAAVADCGVGVAAPIRDGNRKSNCSTSS